MGRRSSRLQYILFLILALTQLGACMSAMAFAQAQVSAGNIRHVDAALNSEYLQLNLDADVLVPEENTLFPVFVSDCAMADDDPWKEMFFGDAAAEVTDENAGIDLQTTDANAFDAERAYSAGAVFSLYAARDARLFVAYRDVDFLESWIDALPDQQVVGIQMTPEHARDIAQGWVDRLGQTLGWDGYELAGCYALPRDETDADFPTTGFYWVEYKHSLNGMPIAYDTPPSREFSFSEARVVGDSLRLYIDDGGIFRVMGHCRFYTQTGEEKLGISLDEAIEIVRNNMDYVYVSGDISTFDIGEIGLCYRLKQVLPASDKDAAVRTEARPAWRFSSAINRNQTDVFTIFVDACTGEILQ